MEASQDDGLIQPNGLEVNIKNFNRRCQTKFESHSPDIWSTLGVEKILQKWLTTKLPILSSKNIC